MTLQETRRQRTVPLQTHHLESRATVIVSAAYRWMRAGPVGWGEVALLAVPQFLLGAIVLSGAFIAKMMGG
jgi:hypothetical protein